MVTEKCNVHCSVVLLDVIHGDVLIYIFWFCNLFCVNPDGYAVQYFKHKHCLI